MDIYIITKRQGGPWGVELDAVSGGLGKPCVRAGRISIQTHEKVMSGIEDRWVPYSTLVEKHSLSYLVLLLGVGPKDRPAHAAWLGHDHLSAHTARETD